MARTITESFLNANLNDLAHAMIRDLAIACKKTAIYVPGHPVAAKAADKAFFAVGAIFRYKRKVSINVDKGTLYALNIGLKDTVFNGEMTTILQHHDVHALQLDSSLKPRDLAILIESMVRRSG